MSDDISDAEALAAAEHVLSLPAEEQIPYLIRFAQHLAAERDRLRDEIGDLEAQVSMLDARTAERDRLREERERQEAVIHRLDVALTHRMLDEVERDPWHKVVDERDRLRAVVDAMKDGPTIRRLVETLEASRNHVIAERNEMEAEVLRVDRELVQALEIGRAAEGERDRLRAVVEAVRRWRAAAPGQESAVAIQEMCEALDQLDVSEAGRVHPDDAEEET